MPIRQDDNQPNRRFGIINLVLIGFGVLLLASSNTPKPISTRLMIPKRRFGWLSSWRIGMNGPRVSTRYEGSKAINGCKNRTAAAS